MAGREAFLKTMALVEIENYSISYDGTKNAVDDVTLSVEEGEILSIVGESGSGKSTLLHGILGLLPRGAKSQGKMLVFGTDISSLSDKELRMMRGEKMSIIFQDTGRYLNPIGRIEKQFRQYLQIHGDYSKDQIHDMAVDLLHRVHLTDAERVLASYPFELSGGMRQRVGIAMAMALQPKLLLADEPTSALDVTIQAQIVRQMMELKAKYGTTIIIVTHNMGVASYMSDRIGVMKDGKLVELGPANEIINDPKDPYTKSLLEAIIELDDERMEKC